MNLLPLIAQNGVHHKLLNVKGAHNAIWDFKKSPDNKIYFSLCSELIESCYARLYEYNRKSDSFECLFNLEDIVFCSDRTIRSSKIHTSISFLPNGHLLMTTHTTDRSPAHPYWLHENYYAHPWEGFVGSHIIEYDPVSKKAFSHGIPIPHESIYGGVYVPKNNTFYFIGYTRGHLYSFNLDTHKISDFGQAVEFGTFLIHLGPDDNLYFAGRSGYLTRFDTEKNEFEHLGVRFDHRPNRIDTHKSMRLDYAVNLNERYMLLTPVHNDFVYIYDIKTNVLKNIGSFGSEQLPPDEKRLFSNIFTPVLDKENVLWYTVSSVYPVDLHTVSLGRWDFMKGQKPELLGTLGSTETDRICSQASEACIIDDIMYIADTNHATDLPGVFSIDLAQFRPHMYENAGYSQDTYVDLKDKKYADFDEYMRRQNEFLAGQPYSVICKEKSVAHLWRHITPELSAVKKIKVTESGACGICGNKDSEYFFSVSEQHTKIKPASEMTDDERKLMETKAHPLIGENIPKLCNSGRNYKATVSALATLHGGKLLVGTRDGVVGIISEDGVYRLGRVGNNGPINDLSASRDGKIVYGISGDPDDLGMVFRYTEENGIEELGMLRFFDEKSGVASSCQPVCCDLSDDGQTLAIGVADRLGCVYILSF